MSRRLSFATCGEPADVLRLEDVPVPEPGHLEVVVRMRCRPINPSDLIYVRGRYGVKPELPAVPGFEGMGVVESVGSGVVRFKPGDRVVPLFTAGTWQEHRTAMVGDLIPVPDGIPDEAAAQLVVNPFTAYAMLKEVLRIDAGGRESDRWLIQTAAGSALGRQIIELGSVWGYRTINVVRRREQAEELLAFGADAAICSNDESLKDRVAEITNGAGAWAAIDAVGGPVGSEVARALRVGGTMLVIAGLSGEPLTIPAGTLLFKQLRVEGFWLSAWKASAQAGRAEAIAAELFGLVADRRLSMPVEASYDLAECRDAVAHAERPGRVGKVLLTG